MGVSVSKYLIYAFLDPRDRLIRYVGKSSSGLRRARSYNDHKHGRCYSWVQELAALGMQPETAILEEIADPKAPGTRCWWWKGRSASFINDVERWWIAYGRALGWDLLNNTDGGEGLLNPHESTLARRSHAMRATWADPETRERWLEALTTPECAKKRSVAQKSSWADPEVRVRRITAVNASQTPEVRAKKSAALKKALATPEARAKKRAVAKTALSTPEYHTKQSEIQKALWADPVEREKRVSALKAANIRPEYRAKLSEAVKLAKGTPEARAKASVASKAMWARKKGGA